ncbi:MAG: transcriptional regulator [Verrucomicrobiota bacterium]|nr:transcriptional regulator [Verrucomicrobiota bacterium]
MPRITGQHKQPAPSALSPIEEEVIGLFVHYAQILSLPKSLGEIYGLLFCSPVPLPLDAFVARLQISKGSASQGLRILRTLNAITPITLEGDRREHFIPETRLRNIVTGILRERIQPQLETTTARLERLDQLTSQSDPDSEIAIRLKRLQAWNEKMRNLLPFVTKMVEPEALA